MCNCRAYEKFRALARRGSRKMINSLMFFQKEGSKISLPIRRNSQSGSCSAFPRIPYAQVATTSVVYRAHSSFASNSGVVSTSKENTNDTVKDLIQRLLIYDEYFLSHHSLSLSFTLLLHALIFRIANITECLKLSIHPTLFVLKKLHVVSIVTNIGFRGDIKSRRCVIMPFSETELNLK